MVRFWKGVFTVCFFLSLTPAFGAQERPLTLKEALDLALHQNPELVVERRRLEIARGELLQARIYPFNPELHIEPGFGSGRAFEGGGGRVTRGVQLNLSQTVEIRGQRKLRIRRARSGLEQVRWLVKDAERQVRAKVVRAFTQVRVAQERVKFAGELVTLLRELHRVVEELFRAGAVPRLDVLRAEVELQRAMNRQILEVRELETARRELALLLGQPPDVVLRAVGPLLLRPQVMDLQRLRRLAFKHRPDLKAAKAGVKVAEVNLALIRAERLWPTLTVSATYEEEREVDTRDRRFLLSLAIPLPLFNRLQGELVRAIAERERRRAAVELILARIEKEVRQAFESLTISRTLVETFRQQILPRQEENFRLLREGYTLGQFRLTDVLVARREFTEGRLEYLDAVFEFNRAAADLEEAVGTGLLQMAEHP